MMWTRSE